MRYAIIGNGVAGITAAFTLRARDARADLTVISGESEYFFSRTALMYSYMDRMEFRALEPYERKAYEVQRIRRIHDWVEDFNPGSLRLRSGATVTFDKLLLATGSVPNTIDWEGLHQVRKGMVHFVSKQDLETCEALTPTTKRAVVVGGGLIGIELVECLRHHGVDVTFLIREPWYWPIALDQEEAAIIAEHIRSHGVDLRLEEQVASVESGPDGRVSAIRTTQGERIECQMLGVTAGVRPAVDWLRRVSTPPELGRGIIVNPGFATSLPGVWAAGDCAEIRRPGADPLIEQIWYSAKRQGELAARAMLGDPVDYRPPVFFNSSKFFEIEYTTVGVVTKAPSDARQFYFRLPGPHASVRIVANARGEVIGCNMLGSRWNHTVLERWILERQSLPYVVDHLQQAQFDVEFGRADVRGLQAAFRNQEGRS
jgi:NADPH-dependent 2,4-dienoyl-CoA reductase/sulfur reductase-like enzyme